MASADLISSIGLGLDIIGVSLVFIYGLPSKVTEGGLTMIGWGRSVEGAEKFRHYKRMAHVGLSLLAVGFALQLASNFVN